MRYASPSVLVGRCVTLWLLFIFGALQSVDAYYVPGWSIKSYKQGDLVPLFVNKITSDSTQLPYAYAELPFVCPISQETESQGLNLGEVLRGDRIKESNYKLPMLEPVKCADLGEIDVDQEALQRADEIIQSNYLVEWIVDNLPGATAFISLDRTKRYYAAGFPIGSVDKNSHTSLLNNHHTFLIRYRRDKHNPDRNVIVGFEVYPKSISNDSPKCASKAEIVAPMVINPGLEQQRIRYTYSVYWREDNSVEWGNRWDMYFSYSEESNHIHWFAIVNSLIIASLLALVVGVILVRTLNRDIQTYKKQENLGDPDTKDVNDVSGWKLVHGDVFRPPQYWSILLSLIGFGAQFLVMTAVVVGFACLGFLNPSFRGGLISFALFLFAFAGVFGGYFNTMISNDNESSVSWQSNALLTALIVPAVILFVVLFLNMVLWANASSSALPFGTIVALFSIWLLLSLPLVFVGSFIASKRKPNHPPGRTASIARQIPSQRKLKSTALASLIGGLLPFAVIFVELAYVLKSIWQEKSGYYYMYGFFALVCGVLIVTVMEMSILMTYFQLNGEDYNWWWRSYLVGAGSSIWVFGYSVYYYYSALTIEGFASAIIFFGYSLLGSIVYGLMTGTIGFIASYVFVRKIYSAIKAE